MNREEWFRPKWVYLKRFAWMAVAGAAFGITSAFLQIEIIALGGLLIIPLLFWVVLVPLLHWKDRYIGEKSTLWGALLLIETSGWFKVAYWFRHIMPDWRQSGRYANTK